jgi:predicted extracellular nuclease
MNKLFLIMLFSINITLLFGQHNDLKCKKNILIMSYNVENLFDTIDDPHKVDNDFLPTSKKKWTSIRYHEKLNHLAKVISSVDSSKIPDIISLVEVENQTVLEDLIKEKDLQKAHYNIVHHESPDRRGIDVALLYNPKSFKLLNQHFYKVEIEGDNYFKTREILYAKLVFKKTKDTLHVFVNHWPSRRGGQEKSEHKRIRAAEVLKGVTDSLFLADIKPRIMIMGDFNDEPTDISIANTLGANKVEDIANNKLYNLSLKTKLQKKGTYYYWKTKEWNMLDQLIVSGQVIKANKGLQIKDTDTQILRKSFFLYTNKEGAISPAKTYGGKKYYGGYSDHLPIYFYLYYKCKRN